MTGSALQRQRNGLPGCQAAQAEYYQVRDEVTVVQRVYFTGVFGFLVAAEYITSSSFYMIFLDNPC